MAVSTKALPEGVTENDIITLRKLIAQNFQDGQRTVASHRKIVATLKNYQDKAVSVGLEDEFNLTFVKMVNRVLPIKKGEKAADRIVQLCENFVAYIQAKDEEEQKNQMHDNDEDDYVDTVATRFEEYLINHLLRGIEAKHKTVRYRVCYLIAATINHLGEISDELFDKIKRSLCKRLFDKEQSVRLQAALALSRLQGVDEDEDDPMTSVSKLLLSSLQHDSSAEVRRAVLLNLERNSKNLPYILYRAWDVHPTNRRVFYTRIMKEIGDFRLLTIGMREQILQWGLRDRDPSVKNAAVKMFVDQWVPATNNDLIEVLERLDVLNSKIASVAMKVFFEKRKDTLDKIEFSEDFWQNLSAESVFLARAFNECCVEHNQLELLETRLPELTKLAYLIQYYLSELDKSNNDPEFEFIVEQLLIIVETYDFGDEVGRRNTLSLLREVLVRQSLNDIIIQRSVEVIKRVCVSESDFSQVIVEIISDIQDTVLDDNKEGTEEEAVAAQEQDPERHLIALLKCLAIAQSALELTDKPLEDNVNLTALYQSLVIPSVRNKEAPVRERGVRCLGLCSLLSPQLASENMMLFGQCYTQGHEDLKLESIRIISDILMIHGTSVLDVEDGIDSRSIHKLYYKAIMNPELPEVQALAGEALCKLILGGVFTEEDLIKTLVLAFFDSDTGENEALQQILSFCIPVFAYSSINNQKLLGNVVVDCFKRLTNSFDKTLVSSTQIFQQLIDWTDPRKFVNYDNSEEAKNSDVHLTLCGDMIKRIASSDSKEERKVLCGSLSKLHFPVTALLDRLTELKGWLAELLDAEVVTETVPKNSLLKFETVLDKAITKVQGGTTTTTVLNDITSSAIQQDNVAPDTTTVQQPPQEKSDGNPDEEDNDEETTPAADDLDDNDDNDDDDEN